MTTSDRWDADTAVESSTPATTGGWSGCRCCWCATSRRPRRSCRTRSWPCTAGGARCGAREGAGLPAPDGGQPVPLRAAAPRGAGEARRRRGRAGPRPAPTRTSWSPSAARPCSTRCATLPGPAARGARAALLPRPLRGGHRLDPRHQPGCREEPCLPRRRRPALPDGGRDMSPRRPASAGCSTRPSPDVEPALRPRPDPRPDAAARPRRGWAWGAGGAVLATAATVAAVVVLTGGPGTTGADPGPARRRAPPRRPSRRRSGRLLRRGHRRRAAAGPRAAHAVPASAALDEAVAAAVAGRADRPRLRHPVAEGTTMQRAQLEARRAVGRPVRPRRRAARPA